MRREAYRWLQHHSPWVARWFSQAQEQIARDPVAASLIPNPQILQDYNKNIATLLGARKYSWAEDTAADALRRFGQGDSPDHLELYRLRVSIAEQRRAWNVAIQRLKALIKVQPHELRAATYHWLARCYLRCNKDIKAEKATQDGMRVISVPDNGPFPPEYIRLYGLSADIAMKREDWPAAITGLKALAGMQSKKVRTETYLKLSDCYFATGDLDQAMAIFEQAMICGGAKTDASDPKHVFFYCPKNPLQNVRGHKHNAGFYGAILYIGEYLKNAGVNLIVVRHPALHQMRNLSAWEKRLKNGHSPSPVDFYKLYRGLKGVTMSYHSDVRLPNPIILDGVGVHVDHCGCYVNFSQGRRQVVGQPDSFQQTVWCVGSSRYVGIFSLDQHTIPSFLQQRFNDLGQQVRVVDCSVSNNTVRNQIETIKRIPFQRGDVVILEERFYALARLNRSYEKSFYALHGVIHCDLNDDFREQRCVGEMFCDNKNHLTYRGNQEIARLLHEKFFSALPVIVSGLMKTITGFHHKLHDGAGAGVNDAAMQAQIDTAYADVPVFHNGTVGAIVMNCNPITRGHMHLITLASQIVKHLYVFVVEEDRSAFSFADRLEMIRRATASLPHVVVVPSGRFILSVETFPEYFEKDMKQEAIIDTSQDIGIFGRYIARRFGITLRFVGEEPTDKVTRQYNAEMKASLPQYGVQVLEIPRLESGGEAISASRVRALLREQQWDAVAAICPSTTVDYLREMVQQGRLTV